MSYYVQVLRERVRLALAAVRDGAHRARDLAAALRELASNMPVPFSADLREHAHDDEVRILRRRVRQAFTSLLAVEGTHWARELAMIFRELADELDPPAGEGGTGSD